MGLVPFPAAGASFPQSLLLNSAIYLKKWYNGDNLENIFYSK